MGNTMNACNYTMADHNIMNSCSSCNGCYQHQIHQQQQPCHIPSNNPHNPTNYNYNVHPTYSHNNIGYNLNENISSSASNTSSCDTNNCQYPSTYYQDSRPTTTTYYPQNQTQNQLQNVNFNQVQQIVPFPRYSNANNLNIPSMPQQQLQQQAQRTPSIAPIFPTQPSISSISAIPIISDITPPRPKKRPIAQILADGQNIKRIQFRRRQARHHQKNKNWNERSVRRQIQSYLRQSNNYNNFPIIMAVNYHRCVM